jgi:hypothetical protein
MDRENYIFNWNQSEGVSTCVITVDGKAYKGSAFCHPKDRDMKSERMGARLAEMRAELEYVLYLYEKANNTFNTLNSELSPIFQSTKINKESYEFHKIKDILDKARKARDGYSKLVKAYKKQIYKYIHDKDVFYKRVRALRESRTV